MFLPIGTYISYLSLVPRNAIRPRTKRGTKTQGVLVRLHRTRERAGGADAQPAVRLSRQPITAAAAGCCADDWVHRSACAGGALCRPLIPVCNAAGT